jgi:two-component system, chemotaxis family, chemotaxis protein CheY
VNAPTILIVDDDADMRLYLRGCLRGLGEVVGAVIEAEDGVEALRRVREDAVGMVISDVIIPGMNGVALRQQIRSDPALRRIPVLLISGEEGGALPVDGRDGFLAKPFNAREFLAAVRHLMKPDGIQHP